MISDKRIIKELKNNSQSAFKKIYYRYQNLVFYQAFNILNNKEDAEDVMQNTFIKFMRNIDAIDNDSNIKQLLSSISKNEAIDLYRKKANRKEIMDETLVNNFKDNNDMTTSSVIVTLNNALDKIDAHIVALKIVYDYSFLEIAKEIDQTIGYVQARYYKALEVLKQYYKGGK